MTDQPQGRLPHEPTEMDVLNKQTGITIGLAIVVVGAAVSAAWWFGRWTGADRAWKEAADKRLAQIEATVESLKIQGLTDRWKGSDMERWTTRFREANPDITVPKPFRESGN